MTRPVEWAPAPEPSQGAEARCSDFLVAEGRECGRSARYLVTVTTAGIGRVYGPMPKCIAHVQRYRHPAPPLSLATIRIEEIAP